MLTTLTRDCYLTASRSLALVFTKIAVYPQEPSHSLSLLRECLWIENVHRGSMNVDK